jgi:hypothetical protein
LFKQENPPPNVCFSIRPYYLIYPLLERRAGYFGFDLVHAGRLRQRAQIAQLITLACDDLAHDTAHNLAGARLGKVRDDVHLLRRREGADNFANLEHEFLVKTLLVVPVIFKLARRDKKKKGSANLKISYHHTKSDTRFEGNESMNRLAGQVISCSDYGGLSNARVHDERRFDFRRRQAMSRYIDHICDVCE